MLDQDPRTADMASGSGRPAESELGIEQTFFAVAVADQNPVTRKEPTQPQEKENVSTTTVLVWMYETGQEKCRSLPDAEIVFDGRCGRNEITSSVVI